MCLRAVGTIVCEGGECDCELEETWWSGWSRISYDDGDVFLPMVTFDASLFIVLNAETYKGHLCVKSTKTYWNQIELSVV